ncbi:MAG: adenylyl-sulfate kinase [Anaerolineales bacterium]|nr:adenylyl-sulfate kinase [Anaerolineales bacterium]
MSDNNKQKGFVLWMTGLSGAGKTTIALILEKELHERGVLIERLDGDVVRQSLTRDLGFSKEDRDKNIERVSFVAKLLSRNGVGVVCSFISPYQAVRDMVRAETTNFLEVFIDAPLEVVMERDVKGLYQKAIAGEIPNFTGISDPFEAPGNPDIHVRTDLETPEESAQGIIRQLETRGLIPTAVPA